MASSFTPPLMKSMIPMRCRVTRMRRLIIALVVLNGVLFAVGELTARQGPARRSDVKVGLVFDIGGRGDGSFNDAAWKGLERARDELGVDIEAIEPGDGSDREGALRQLAA